MAMTDEQRIIGQLEAKVEAIDRRGELMAAQLLEVRKELAGIHRMISEAKGGWKVLLAMVALSGTIGALAGKFLPFLLIK